ncbi:hypothetical protein PF011_g12567 [Phytophthora fragariae]|uniref:Uncharacterized protein n=1 Tax=Phytophthora fragariae TaxID=53985 RepID=A0A6A3K9U3_9STRA|nr:hypothetical protein PF011_g12567 [Phytophthora fragariae]
MPQSGGDEGGVEERGRVIRCKHPVEELTAYARMSAVPVDMAEHASVETEAEDAKSEKKLRAGLTHPTVLLRGGGCGTPAARRRQRRTEAELAAVQHVLVVELRERQQERTRVLRAMAQQAIGRVQRQQVAVETRRQEVRSVIGAVKKLEVAAMQTSLPPQPKSNGHGDKLAAHSKEKRSTQEPEVTTRRPRTDALQAEWLACERQWLDSLPVVLAEEGTLAEMRAARKRAVKAVKKYKVVRRAYRLQRRRQQEEQRKAVSVEVQQTKDKKCSRQKMGGYTYAKQGNYDDAELVPEDGGKTRREAPLRSAGAGEPNCLPTALLAFTRRHTQEVVVLSTSWQAVNCANTGGASRETPPLM